MLKAGDDRDLIERVNAVVFETLVPVERAQIEGTKLIEHMHHARDDLGLVKISIGTTRVAARLPNYVLSRCEAIVQMSATLKSKHNVEC